MIPVSFARIRPLALVSALLSVFALSTAAAAQSRDTVRAPRRIPALYPGFRYTPPPPDTTAGVRLLLSEWHAAEPGFLRPPVRSRPLTPAEALRVLARLRPIHAADAAADSFFFPAETLPPPRRGRTVTALLPPRDSSAARPRPAVRAAAVLEVARRAPEGAVDREAAEVLITFSQPMVPLSAPGDLQARAVPVQLSPQPEGAWRWIDTRTLRFAARAALPAATEYTVEIPAGTRSATGIALPDAVRWSFWTPPPTAGGAWPQGLPSGLSPLLVVAFDQRVDAAAVLGKTSLQAFNGERVPLRVATAAEVAADTQVTRLTAGLRAGEWVAFRPTAALPAGAQVRVSIGPGTPSAEGARVTDHEQYWDFTTRGPFRLLRAVCDTACPARQPIAFSLSNQVDARTFRPEMVRVHPAIAGLRSWVSEDVLVIDGDTRAGTRYTVTVDPALRDIHGQPLVDTAVAASVSLPYASLGVPREVAVLDPLGPRTTTVMTVAHGRVRLRVMRVRPEDWFRFLDVRMASARPARLPGVAVVDREVAIDAADGDPHPLEVDVSPALANGVGHAVVAVEALDGATDDERRQAAYVWVQGTRIGLGAFIDERALTAWGTSLLDGAPAAGARAELVLRDSVDRDRSRVIAAAMLDARGVATLPLAGDTAKRVSNVTAALRWRSSGERQQVLMARQGADVALLAPEMINRWDSSWMSDLDPPRRLWYGFTDRTLYRPGETVRFKGWVRAIARHDGGPALAAGIDSVRWTAWDEEENEIARGVSRLTPLGGFDGRFDVPAGASLGEGHISFQPLLPGKLAAHSADADDDDDNGDDGDEVGYYYERYTARIRYRIDEFRRPEYTVTATASEGPHFIGGTAEVTARATYFAGGALPGAPVTWEVTAAPGRFTPPGWSEWSFGDVEDTWARDTLRAVTDAQGRTGVRVALDRVRAPIAYTISAEATVTDVNRQTWTASEHLLVHPASIYAGLRPERPWLQRGDSIRVRVAAVDLDGKAVAGRTVELRAVGRSWRFDGGRWQEQVVDSTATCVAVSAARPVRCAFAAAKSGWYTVTATTRDDRGRATRTAARVWVMGGDATFDPTDRANAAREVQLQADKAMYEVGDTARILVRTRFFPSRGVVTLRRNGIASTRAIRVDASTASIAIPITGADIPNVNVVVDLVGARARGDSVRGVNRATGTVDLGVSTATRALTVRALPRDSVSAPDGPASVSVRVTDAAGRPVRGAEVALVVVDEAVLALAGYVRPDPVRGFYPRRRPEVRWVDGRVLVQVMVPDFPPAAGTLVGRVLDLSTGGFVAGATVTLAGTELTATTDAAGRFRITGLAPGRYTLRVRQNGFDPVDLPVTVGPTPAAPVRVALTRAGSRIRIRGASALAQRGLALESVVVSAMGVATYALQGKAAGVSVEDGERGAPIAIRGNFDPLALFTPTVRTGADGRATVPFTLPSNLTRYRVIAVAAQGATHYGVGESTITARRPLMVRPSAPRFLNWGDRFELPVVVQNQTGAPVEADVAVRGDGIELVDAGQRVTVPAHDRVEVRLRATAARAGDAALQVAAASPDGLSDAAEITLPVYTPATAEAFATHGTFTGDSSIVLPMRVPADAIPSFGGLEVGTSSTALQELTDALLYLVRYPYECSEQIASRLLGVTALRDVLSAFRGAELPAPEVLQASVERDVRALAGRVRDGGEVGLWDADDRDFPYATLHTAHALQRAREKGYAVPDEAMRNLRIYLRRVPSNPPSGYPADVRRALHAYALYIRARMADDNTGADVRRFMAKMPRDSITVEMAGWLLSATARDPSLAAEQAELLRIINNAATETSSTATFATRYGDGEYLLLHSSRRTDGVVLDGLLAAQPDNPLVPKIVRGLLAHRQRGRWNNTQENAWVLIALDRYFRAYEGQTPDFVARVWLGERYAGGHRFAGRETDRWQLSVPMRVLQAESPDAVTIGAEGRGRVYYRAALRYAPRALDLPALDAGFAVSRRYDAVDDPGDVRQDSAGAWHVRAGARVRITLTMTAPSRRLHVALADPLPAGLEPVNPELQGARSAPPAPATADERSGTWGWWWRRYWYEHQNLRDQRGEAFTSLLAAGTYTWSYVARATTPGTFIAPPPHAEEMYSPETFGRGASDRVIVEAPEP